MFSDAISTTTPIEIGVVVTLGVSFIGGAVKITKALSSFGHSLDLFKQHVDLRLTALEEKTSVNVRRSEFRAWIHEARALNPNLKLPSLSIDHEQERDME